MGNNEDAKPVKPRSDAEIEAIAAECRDAAGMNDPAPDILPLIKAAAEKFRVSRGLTITVVDDEEIPDREAEACFETLSIRLSRSTAVAAEQNEPRARMTLAHEFGHIILEHGGVRPREHAERKSTPIRAYFDAEHQTKVFAPAFLIPRALVTPPMSIRELQLRFRVSEIAARIRHEQIFGKPGSQASPDIKAAIAAMKASNASPPQRDAAKIAAQFDDSARKLWHNLEKIEDPLKDPDLWRLARGFAVYWPDRHVPRSHYGWLIHYGQIRNYRDIETS